ncbi:MAG: prephenate dehydratase [Bacteroidota bacterium]|nr:prephenate dehydratase [Bacteroidota bacterium]
MTKKISIQGYEGSFHQIAAQEFLGKEIEIIPCDTFREVVKVATDTKQSDGGFMAIENSIAGSILPNYTLLQKSKLKIVGEIYLQIHQNLMVNPGVKMEDIREVHSHPMALLQCMDFLEKHPLWKLVEKEDTALSAKHIHLHHHKHVAVIASKLAGQIFNLDILAPKIQSNKNNYTRFLYLQPEKIVKVQVEANKASINFVTDHSKGSLAKVLTKIADGNINLSKLQSMPIPEQEWKYSFHADMEFDSIELLHNVLESIKPVTESLNVLGIYQQGKTVK